jgi:hypothetical protein
MEPGESFEPIGTPEGAPGFDVETEPTAEPSAPVAAEAVAEPEPALPQHLERSLNGLLGGDLEAYRAADEATQLELITNRLCAPETNNKGEVIAPTPESTLQVLKLITESSQQQLAAKLGSVEGATDLLARASAVSVTARRLGANKLAGWLGLGAGVGAAIVTNKLLHTAETAAGTGGVIGAAAGALGYQQIYQRTVENRWQRGQSSLKTVTDRVLRPLTFAFNEVMPHEKENAVQNWKPEEGRNVLSRGYRSARVWLESHRSAQAGRARAEESRVHLSERQVEGLPREEVLWRLAEGRLALTRQDRRTANWRGYEPNRRAYNETAYEALVRRAAREFSPEEIAQAIDRTDRNTRLHLVGSVATGIVGAAAGFFGMRAWQAEHSVVDTPEKPVVPPASQTDAPGPASVLNPTSHDARAALLEKAGAGHFEHNNFVITAPNQIDGAGNGWIQVGEHRLTVTYGVTDTRPLADYLTADLQQTMTGHNLAEQYAPGADQVTIDEAVKIKDSLASYLLEQQLHGTGTLAAGVQHELQAAGYDFDLSDMKNADDVRQEIHQAMSRWFKQHAETAAPANEHLVFGAAKPAAQLETDLFKPAPVKAEVTVAPEPTSTPRVSVGQSEPADVQPAEYNGWQLPIHEPIVAEPHINTPAGDAVAVAAPEVTVEPASVMEITPAETIQAPVATPVNEPAAAPVAPVSAPRIDREITLDDYFSGPSPTITAKDLEEVVGATH